MASASSSLVAASRCYVPLVLLSALLLLLLLLLPRAISGPAEESDEAGTQWAVLVAGSSGYANYRHQADVCHAYQLLRKGGLKEENIVVFMYDDVASDPLNPRPGILINHPDGGDVYAGVPKDYTGKQVTSKNLFAALLGNKNGVDGGSGKVIDSGPNDRIFIYYTDHGGPGVLGMPNEEHNIYASDLIKVLKEKHASRSYREMVIYVEACESGSIFEGLLPEDLNIYAVTAANANENSYATYCPGGKPPSPPEYFTCLGDLYSVSWMEDSDTHDRKKETIRKQYQVVKERTSNNNTYDGGSHVMEYGNKSISAEKLYLFQGFKPSNVSISDDAHPRGAEMGGVNQRDAHLLFLWQRYKQLDDGSENKPKILKEITETMASRTHLDSSVDSIGKIIFGEERGPSILTAVRPSGQALVDDWDCLKSMVHVFESHCGQLTQYGLKHMRAFANICNWGITKDSMEAACVRACQSRDSVNWRARNRGYSA